MGYIGMTRYILDNEKEHGNYCNLIGYIEKGYILVQVLMQVRYLHKDQHHHYDGLTGNISIDSALTVILA